MFAAVKRGVALVARQRARSTRSNKAWCSGGHARLALRDPLRSDVRERISPDRESRAAHIHVLFALQTLEQHSVLAMHGEELVRQHLLPLHERLQQSFELSHEP